MFCTCLCANNEYVFVHWRFGRLPKMQGGTVRYIPEMGAMAGHQTQTPNQKRHPIFSPKRS